MSARFYTVSRSLAQSLVHGAAIFAVAAVALVGGGWSTPAQALDGCKVLLCMAGNWKNIAPCTSTVREALRDVARGRMWPQCGMSGNSDTLNQSVAPEQCPVQYRGQYNDYNDRLIYTCPYSGVVQVSVQGQPWSRTWWSATGDTVVEWLPAARAALANQPDAMDGQFDRDYATWLAAQPPAPNPPGDTDQGG